MIPMAEIIFWLCVVGVVIAYPVMLLAAVLLLRRAIPWRVDDQLRPSFTIVVAARNEEAVIRGKIENCLALDYPPDLLDVVVVNDQSEDGTAAIVAEYAHRRVSLVDFGERLGKTRILNRILPAIQGEIAVMTDANVLFDPMTLRHFARWFGDERVGLVSGYERRVQSERDKFQAETWYRDFEVLLKAAEGRLGAVMGAHGGLYALRKSCWRTLPDNALSNDDLATAMNVLRQGRAVIHDSQARAIEYIGAVPDLEFGRRLRIGAGNYQCVGWNLWLLNPLHGWKSFFFWTHKILRWFMPHMMVAALLSHGVMAWGGKLVPLFVLHVAAYGVGAVGILLNRRGRGGGLVSALGHFIYMNAALGFGFLKYVRGIQDSTWNPTRR